jgi:ATP-dependent RNA helicase DHX37/DHR1
MQALVSAKNITTISKHKKRRKPSESVKEESEEGEEEFKSEPEEKQEEEIPKTMQEPILSKVETFDEKLMEIQQEHGIDTDEDEQEDNKLSKDIQEILTHFKRPKKVIEVVRKPEIEKIRKQLPITLQEQDLIEVIENNVVMVISGETGSGKSTQIPQFLYERGYSFKESANPGRIGITQPRRIAAVSLSQRVAEELNVVHGKEVGYQIRYDASLSSSTQIKVYFNVNS